MRHPHRAAVLLLTSAVFATGAGAQMVGPSEAELADGSRRMAAFLAHAASTSDPVINLYLNHARAAGLRTLLGRPMAPIKEVQLRSQIGYELLKAGQMRESIEELKRVQDLIRQHGLRAEESYHYMLRDRLAIANLRMWDESIGRRPAHGWMFPMRQAGGEPFDTAARAAIGYYAQNLASKPGNLATRWLLNIAYMALGEYPDEVPEEWLIPLELFEAEYDIGHFTDIAPQAGVDTYTHAGGSVMEDFDGDGLLDIVTSSRGMTDQLRFYRNEGDGTFADWTRRAGLMGQLGGLNLVHADYDNDGDRDVTVFRGAWMGEAGKLANSLLQNQGDGRFYDVTFRARVLSFKPTHSGSWGDYDNDGWLDLFIGNETSPPPKPRFPNELFHNNRDGTFTEVAGQEAVDGTAFVKGTGWGDYDNDGMLDLYVSHLNGDNVLYHNEGETGTAPRFRQVTDELGVAEPYVSFSTWFWDYDNDGWEDLFVAGFDMERLEDMANLYLGLPMRAGTHRLYRNRGDGTFEEVSEQVRLNRVILTMGSNYGDLDSDGYLDCYFGTGMPDMRALLPDRVFRNDGGRTFQDVTASGGFGSLQKGHGVSFGDLDNDGDQDIYHVLGAAFEGDEYENVLLENPGHGNHWLYLYLEGVRSNRDGLGARIRVRVTTASGRDRDIYLTVRAGSSFGSSTYRREIGLGDAADIQVCEIYWPASGQRQRLEGLQRDRAYRVREGDSRPVEVALRRFDLSP